MRSHMKGTFHHGMDMHSSFLELEKTEGPCYAKMVHHFSHRYAKTNEGAKDRLTYHSGILVEWNHGRYCTVLELAFLNGVGGWGGRSNWHEDSFNNNGKKAHPKLLSALPEYMIMPWKSHLAELRCHDIDFKGVDDFKAFVKKHEMPRGKGDKRFLDFTFVESDPVMLACRSKADIARFLVNYISNNKEYHEENRNCQTFAADLYHLLTGKPTKPFHPVCQILYYDHLDWFLFGLV